jgi:hypothetical protein
MTENPLATAISQVLNPLVKLSSKLPAPLAYGLAVLLTISVLALLSVNLSNKLLLFFALIILSTLVIFVYWDSRRRFGVQQISGPLHERQFRDDRLSRIARELIEMHQRQNTDLLPTNRLLEVLLDLFNRKTFREPFKQCVNQNWSDRVRVCYQTLEVLHSYERNVRERGTAAQKALYTDLVYTVDAYSMEMQSRLLKEQHFDSTPDGALAIPDGIHDPCETRRKQILEVIAQLKANPVRRSDA